MRRTLAIQALPSGAFTRRSDRKHGRQIRVDLRDLVGHPPPIRASAAVSGTGVLNTPRYRTRSRSVPDFPTVCPDAHSPAETVPCPGRTRRDGVRDQCVGAAGPIRAGLRGSRRTDEVHLLNQGSRRALQTEQDHARDDEVHIGGTERARKPRLRLLVVTNCDGLILAWPSIWAPPRKNASIRPCPAQSKSSLPPSVKKLLSSGRARSPASGPHCSPELARPLPRHRRRRSDSDVIEPLQHPGDRADQHFFRCDRTGVRHGASSSVRRAHSAASLWATISAM